MDNYQTYLKEMYSPKTFKRKLDYIKYNFRKEVEGKKEILEIWPGMGEFVDYINTRNEAEISIIDNDSSVIEYCTKKYKVKESFSIKTSISEIEKNLKEYDLIFMSQILEHVPKEEQTNLIKILYKHLKKNWTIIITVPNAGNFLTLTEIYGDITHTTAFTENSLQQLAKQVTENENIQVRWLQIPPNNPINLIRILFQKILHGVQLLMYMAHGGSFSKILTSNISLIMKK